MELGRWDPFGDTVGAFAGFPAVVDEGVVEFAAEGEFVDVGEAVVGAPFVAVMDLAEVAGFVAAWEACSRGPGRAA